MTLWLLIICSHKVIVQECKVLAVCALHHHSLLRPETVNVQQHTGHMTVSWLLLETRLAGI